MSESDFWLRVGDGAGHCLAALIRLLRYGNADQQAWHSLRGGLLLVADAIGKRFARQDSQTTTAVMPVNRSVRHAERHDAIDIPMQQ